MRLALGGSRIRIPGMSVDTCLHGFARDSLEILRTKTRPRLLFFVGSDGVNYSFLLKGKEDLSIDQRVLQVASYINSLVAQEHSRPLVSAVLVFSLRFEPPRMVKIWISVHWILARFGSVFACCLGLINRYHCGLRQVRYWPIPTYAVTSLSPDVGLIFMIDDAVSLFRLNRLGQGSCPKESLDSQVFDDAGGDQQQDMAESTTARSFLANLHQLLQTYNLPTSTPRR